MRIRCSLYEVFLENKTACTTMTMSDKLCLSGRGLTRNRHLVLRTSKKVWTYSVTRKEGKLTFYCLTEKLCYDYDCLKRKRRCTWGKGAGSILGVQ